MSNVALLNYSSPVTEEIAPEVILRLRGFGVAFRERTVLSSVDLDIPARGIVVLMGPSGTGKSTLVRTLAGFNATNPGIRTWGEASYLGRPLGTGELPSLVAQSARLLMSTVFENLVSGLPERRQLALPAQRALVARLLARADVPGTEGILDKEVVQLPLALQRVIAILRMNIAKPRLLCVDEPTTDIPDADNEWLLAFLRRIAKEHAVLVVLHNQGHARTLGGDAVLLAGGVVQDRKAIPTFFDAPTTAIAREFARSGTCTVPSPDADPETLDENVPPPVPVPEEARRYVSDAFGPRGFLWVKNGRLAGTPKPGVVLDAEYDLEALKRVGVDSLITLTEAKLESEPLERFGITSYWFPIPDMGAPSQEQAESICQEIDRLLVGNHVVAVHCYAGLGRTGTVLAAYLIWEGQAALAALEAVRRIDTRWVQSTEQVAFLQEFARTLESRGSAKAKKGRSLTSN